MTTEMGWRGGRVFISSQIVPLAVRPLCAQEMQCLLSAALLAHAVVLQGQMNIFNNNNFGGGFQVAFFGPISLGKVWEKKKQNSKADIITVSSNSFSESVLFQCLLISAQINAV